MDQRMMVRDIPSLNVDTIFIKGRRYSEKLLVINMIFPLCFVQSLSIIEAWSQRAIGLFLQQDRADTFITKDSLGPVRGVPNKGAVVKHFFKSGKHGYTR